MSLAECSRRRSNTRRSGYPIDSMLAQSIARGQEQPRQVSDHGEDVPAGRTAAQGRRAAEESRSTRATLRKLVEAEKPRRSRRRSARGRGDPGRLRSFLQGRHRRRSSSASSRRTAACMTAADLAAYEPEWQEPLHVTYRGYDVYSNPSTSRGGFEVLMQPNLVERSIVKACGAGSPPATHAMIEAIKVAKADIYRYVADPKFTRCRRPACSRSDTPRRAACADRSGKAGALSRRRLHRRAADDLAGAAQRPAAGFAERYEAEQHTTSFSIVDPDGNAVAVHADARRPLRQQRGGRRHRAAAEQRHASRLDVAVPRQRQLRRAPARSRSSTTRRSIVMKDGKLAMCSARRAARRSARPSSRCS